MSGKPIVLVYDGHGSRIADEMIELALKNNNILFCLPPHTTHQLQPLDVGVFGPVQTAWSDRCDIVVETTGEGIPRKRVVVEYMIAQKAAFTEHIILQAWRRSGIRPFNPGIFTEADYAPSNTTSTVPKLPTTFPSCEPPEEWVLPSSDDPDFEPSTADGCNNQESSDSNSDSSDTDSSDDSDDEMGLGQSSTSRRNTVSNEGGLSDHPTTHMPEIHPYSECAPLTSVTALPVPINFDPSESTSHSQPLPGINTINRQSQSLINHCRTCSSSSIAANQMSIDETNTSDSGRSQSLHSHCRTRSSTSIPSTRPSTPFETSWSEPRRVQTLLEENRILRERAEHAEYERDFAEAHCTLMGREFAKLHYQLNSKNDKGGRQSIGLNTQARCLTDAEGLAAWGLERAKRAEKAREKDERHTRKVAKEAELAAQRAAIGDTAVFSGSLASKNKPDLQDIARALSLSEDSTKQALVDRINASLTSQPELQSTSGNQ
jgi:hypothetical protein